MDILIIGGITLGMTTLLAAPIAVVMMTPVIAMLGRDWLRIKERELEIRQLQHVKRMQGGVPLPDYVDADDLKAVLRYASRQHAH